MHIKWRFALFMSTWLYKWTETGPMIMYKKVDKVEILAELLNHEACHGLFVRKCVSLLFVV